MLCELQSTSTRHLRKGLHLLSSQPLKRHRCSSWLLNCSHFNHSIAITTHQCHYSSTLSDKSTTTTTTATTTESGGSASSRQGETLPTYEEMLKAFCDCQTAHAPKTNLQLLRAIIVFKLCQWSWLVENNKKLMKLCQQVFGLRIFRFLMKMTFYSHFVAGENQTDIRPVITNARKYGVKSILDYSAEKDLSKEEAKQKVVEGLEVVEQPAVRPDAATNQFQTSLQFADRSASVTSARTYFYESELACERHKDIFLRCIDAVSGSTNKEGFAAIKLTALGRPQLLLQMSDFLVQLERFLNILACQETSQVTPSLRKIDRDSFRNRLHELGVKINFDEESEWFTLLDVQGEGEIDLLDWNHLKRMEKDYAKIFKVFNTSSGKYEQLVPTLTAEGLEEMRNMIRRIDELALAAKSSGVRLMIDAEQTYFQPAIRRIVMELMRKFNKDYAVVFNTYQCYLKDAAGTIATDLHMAEVEDFYFGAKLVRGAYMEQERARAQELNYPDPICDTYDATTNQYNLVLDTAFNAIHRRPKGKVAVMLATHNENTILSAIKKMHENNIKISDRLICFGQLFGMCDHISFNLGAKGFSVYKYLPYGPVEEVLPYLSRRALENRSIISKASKDREILWMELWRRLRNGQFFHRP